MEDDAANLEAVLDPEGDETKEETVKAAVDEQLNNLEETLAEEEAALAAEGEAALAEAEEAAAEAEEAAAEELAAEE